MGEKRKTFRRAVAANRSTYISPEHIGGVAMSAAYRQARDIRSSRQWDIVRKMVIQREPVCQWCGKQPAEEAHHVKPVAEHPELAFHESNLLAVCARCHALIESAVKRGIDLEAIRKGVM